MPYRYIHILPASAPLDEVINDESEYNQKVRKEIALAKAAPELLKTMQALIDLIETLDGRDDEIVVKTVETLLRAAIIKATGEPQ